MSQEMIAALISGLGGVFLGSMVSYYAGKYHIRISTVSASRQEWINTLRETLADFLTQAFLIIEEASDPQVDATQIQTRFVDAILRIRLLMNKIELLINPNEDDHKELVVLVKRLENATSKVYPKAISELESLQAAITSLAQTILKREWERVKAGK